MQDSNHDSQQTSGIQQISLPNASVVLVLGICSIILCWCQGVIGLILGIIALVIASKDLALYNADPQQYTMSSYNNLRNGRTIAIIGLVLAGFFLFMLIIGLLFLGLNFALLPWEMIEEFDY